MKKGDELQGLVTRVDFPNKGLVLTDEGEIHVKGVLPGEKVLVRVAKKRAGKTEGRLLAVLEKAPEECSADCPHYGLCGGCSLRTLPYEASTALKAEQVKRLLDNALSEVDPELKEKGTYFEGIIGSPRTIGYRNKMEFTFGDEIKGGPLSVGLHKKDSFYDILSVTDCRIVDEDFRAILKATRDFFAERCENGEVSFYHRLNHTGSLRHLLVRKAVKTGEILVDLVTTSDPVVIPMAEAWKEKLLSLELTGKFAGILHTINDSQADAIKDEGTTVLYGQDFFVEEILGLTFRVSTFSFFQTNSLGAEVLYETARRFLTESGATRRRVKRIFDLYTGTGTIAQLLSPAAEEVIGVEIVEEAVRAAEENCRLNGLDNCRFIAGDVLKVLDEIEEKPEVIVLDPPRDGVHPKALPKILSYGVQTILYISCKPTSLARDTAGFYKAGYGLDRAVCVDMFPWTTGVETIAVFSKRDSLV